MAILLVMLFEFDGVWMIVQYRNDVFAACFPADEKAVHHYALLFCGVYAFVTLLPMVLIDRFGRRPLLWAGFAGSFVMKVLLGVGLSLKMQGWPVALLVVLWAGFVQAGISGVVNVIIAELYDSRHRSVGMAFCFFVMLMTGMLLNFVYRRIVETVGHGGWAFAFAGA